MICDTVKHDIFSFLIVYQDLSVRISSTLAYQIRVDLTAIAR